MGEILDAIQRSILFSALPWMTVVIPMTAALGRRRGLSLLTTAGLCLVPLPFASWLVVLILTKKGRRQGASQEQPLSADSALESLLAAVTDYPTVRSSTREGIEYD